MPPLSSHAITCDLSAKREVSPASKAQNAFILDTRARLFFHYLLSFFSSNTFYIDSIAKDTVIDSSIVLIFSYHGKVTVVIMTKDNNFFVNFLCPKVFMDIF